MTLRPSLRTALLAALALLATGVQAQGTLQAGYIDTDRIVVQMPEFRQVQEQLQQQQQAVGARVRVVQDSLSQILQTRVEEYQTFDQSPLATDEARRERQQEIYGLQVGIEQAQQEGLQYLSYVEARLLQPVLTKVDEAIAAESRERGLDLVLPTVANNAPVFLYASDRLVNITEDVMVRLGIDPAAAAAEASSAAPPVNVPASGATGN